MNCQVKPRCSCCNEKKQDVIRRQTSSSPFGIFTMRLHVMQRTVLLSQFCPSVWNLV